MKKQTLYRLALLAYLCMMIYLMFLMRIGTHHAHLTPHYNLVPFGGIRIFIRNLLGDDPYWMGHAIVNLVGNVVMFVPAGFLTPRAGRQLDTLPHTLAVCLSALLVVESVQLASLLGSFDVDDIILNMTGVLIGWLLHRALTKNKKEEQK